MFMPAVPRSRRGWWYPGQAALVALLLLSGCATGAPPGGLLASWHPRPLVPPESPDTRAHRAARAMMEEEARRRRESETAALEAAIATAYPRAWEVAKARRRVGTRLLLRLRVEDGHVLVRDCEAEEGLGREGIPVGEVHFRHMLELALPPPGGVT